jgi:hypothetical protein
MVSLTGVKPFTTSASGMGMGTAGSWLNVCAGQRSGSIAWAGAAAIALAATNTTVTSSGRMFDLCIA